MAEFKVGFGYDIHPLKAGRRLVLGGVEIPNPKGLLGHSDADVLIHAVCDAILGALGQGDIGEHFPDTDPAYKDIASTKLLEQVAKLMFAAEYKIGNLDTMIIAEQPKISQAKDKMQGVIAPILNTEKDNVNIKAATAEGLGPVGANQAIAAYAVVTIIRR